MFYNAPFSLSFVRNKGTVRDFNDHCLHLNHVTIVHLKIVILLLKNQRSYIEGLETNHVRHRLLYLRARAMPNSAIHTSTGGGRILLWGGGGGGNIS